MEDVNRIAAEADLIKFLRASGTADFALTISRTAGRWSVATTDHDADGASNAKGKGASFADAWRRQSPLWARGGER